THVSMSDIRVGHKKTPAKRGRESPSRDRHKKRGPRGPPESIQAGRKPLTRGSLFGAAVGSSSQKHREPLDVDVAMRDCDSLHIPQQCTMLKSRDRRQKRGMMILNHFSRGR